jgi:hypothetical protein
VAELTEEQREALAQTIQPAFDEWLFRMHGTVSSCGHETEAAGIADALAPVVAAMLAKQREQIAQAIEAENESFGVGEGHGGEYDKGVHQGLRDAARIAREVPDA